MLNHIEHFYNIKGSDFYEFQERTYSVGKLVRAFQKRLEFDCIWRTVYQENYNTREKGN